MEPAGGARIAPGPRTGQTRSKDHGRGRDRHWTGCAIQHPPSHHFDAHACASFIGDSIGVKLRDEPGGGNIMWSSGHPHSHAVIADNFRGVPDAGRDWILFGCAEQFFGLK